MSEHHARSLKLGHQAQPMAAGMGEGDAERPLEELSSMPRLSRRLYELRSSRCG